MKKTTNLIVFFLLFLFSFAVAEKAVALSCTGTIPANASYYDKEEMGGLRYHDYPWKYSASDTSTKCQYRCNSGYNWNGSSCVIYSYSCTGTIPANAAAYDAEESTSLTANTAWSRSTSDTATKCQYRCNSGYNWNGSSCAPIVNGSCGSNVRTSTSPYPSSTTSWPSTISTAFCASGTAPSTTPKFPSAGSSTNWTCTGTGGGSSASCAAYRAVAPINGSCGSNATNYPYSTTSYSGTFCSMGTASPTSPAFPTPGGSTTWSCNSSNGGTNKSCMATRTSPPLPANVIPTASINSPSSNQAIKSGASISFSGIGTDSDGIISGYEWRLGNCSTGTLLSSSASFSRNFSSVGTYNIYLRVKDNSNAYSNNCPSRTITVSAATSGSTGSCTKNLVYMPVTIGGGPNDCRGVGCVGMSEGQSCSSEGSGCMVACTEMSGVQLLVCMDPACYYDIYNRTVSCPPCNYSCTGTIPANAAAYDAEESTSLTANTAWSRSTSDTATKCQYRCNSGYNWNGSSCAPIVNGSCGSNVRTSTSPYPSSTTSWPSTISTAFCASGTAPSTTPKFPSAGSSTNWTCTGTGGGSSASCAAYRAVAPINGSCGSNATNYPYSTTSYSGTFCSMGTASPTSPAFPTPGGSTTWSCNGSNGGTNKSCMATRNSMCTVNTAPNVTITAPTANRTITAGTSVSFAGSASDPNGNTITNYEWRVGSCTGTLLSSSSSFSYTFSNIGTYNIYFRAYDGCVWSACQSRAITVNPASCTSGTIPSGGIAFDSEESTGLTVNTAWTQSTTDTATKCQYRTLSTITTVINNNSCDKELKWIGGIVPGGAIDCRGTYCSSISGASSGYPCSSEGTGCIIRCTSGVGIEFLTCLDKNCYFADPMTGYVCPPVTCSCTESIPANNATMCTDDSTTTSSLPWQNVPLNGCTTRKCEFSCDSGYNYNPATNTCDAIVNGSCGTNAQTYPYSTTAWPSDIPVAFCASGNAPATPASFPSAGSSTSWTCTGSNGGSNAPCSAYRQAAANCSRPSSWNNKDTIAHTGIVPGYKDSSPSCGSTCESRDITCLNGTLHYEDSEYSKETCVVEDCPNPPSYSSWKEVRP